jgi:hypothetical protein
VVIKLGAIVLSLVIDIAGIGRSYIQGYIAVRN